MSFLEITGFIFGVAGVWLTIKQHVACFPVGLVNVVISLFLFIELKLYSDSLQQGVYIILLSYGWYRWSRNVKMTSTQPSYMNNEMKIYLFIIFLILSFIMGYLFDNFTDADVPYIDAIATSMSFAAQYLIARKKIENWLIWIAVNLLYIGIYSYKEVYLYVVLFLIYLILAVKGYFDWKSNMKTDKQIIHA